MKNLYKKILQNSPNFYGRNILLNAISEHQIFSNVTLQFQKK